MVTQLRNFAQVGLLLLAVCTLAFAAPPGKRDWPAIERIVRAQLAAFAADDAATAFSFASPAIRYQVGNAERFMAMVRTSYRPVYRQKSATFLQPAVIEGSVIQPVRIVTEEDDVVVALYRMERDDKGRWSIAGCELAPSTERMI